MRRSWAILPTLLLLLLVGAAAQGADLYVPTPYATIQAAIGAANNGDIIHVESGEYIEQLDIAKNVTIVGAGAGLTFVKAYASMPLSFNSGSVHHPLIYVHDTANAVLENMTIDGDGQGSTNSRFDGVAFWNAGGAVLDCEILRVRDTPLSGAQHGVGVYAYNNISGSYTVTLTNVVIDDFQKNGTALSGAGLTVALTNVSTSGAGPTTVTAQNGIQISYGAGGTVTDCAISDIYWIYNDVGTRWTATGLLLYDGTHVTVTNTTVDECQTGIYLINVSGHIGNCVVNGASTANDGYDGVDIWTDAAKGAGDSAPRAVPSPIDADASLPAAKAAVAVEIANTQIIGSGTDQELDTWGVWAGGEANVGLTMTGCTVSGWDYGVGTYEDWGGTVTAVCHANRIMDNASYGFDSSTESPADARYCWWGDPTGPNTDPAKSGTGDRVSPSVLYEPWVSGNIICYPDSQYITSADADGKDDVVVTYLGGMDGPLYSFEIDVTWSSSVVTANLATDITRPDSGPFHDADIFMVFPITNGARVVAALGGDTPGITSGQLFKILFTAVDTPYYAASAVNLTVNKAREYVDGVQSDLTGYVTDPGMVVVDFGAPAVSDVFIENTTLSHTDDYIRNGQAITVTADVSDGDPAFGAANIRADLSAFVPGGTSVAPTEYTGGVATWTVGSVVCDPANGTAVVAITATDPAGNVNDDDDDIITDNTPPAAVSGFTAAPGHNKVSLAWTSAYSTEKLDYRGVLIRYDAWNEYPVYDSAAPSYPADPAGGEGAAFDGLGDVAAATHERLSTERDIYYYSAFIYDEAMNFSEDPAEARATSYWLGDVCGTSAGDEAYNGLVNVPDVVVLGSAYGEPSLTWPLNEADVGPTDNMSRLGIPEPDNAVDFEDLMIFAMNFGVVSDAKMSPPAATEPVLAWRALDATTWVLSLDAACPALQGLNLSADLPRGVTAQVSPGELLRSQTAPVFLRNIASDGLNAGLALLGTNVGIAGSGELLRVTLPEGVMPTNVTIKARSVENVELAGELAGTPDLPPVAAFQLAPNAPNPFNPKTTIAFALPTAESVRLTIYSLDGRRVRTLVEAALPAGRHEITWDGRDDAGRQAASGTYIYRLEAGDFRQARKMVLTK